MLKTITAFKQKATAKNLFYFYVRYCWSFIKMLVMPTNFIDCVFWKFVLFSEWSHQLVVKNSQGRVSGIWECERKTCGRKSEKICSEMLDQWVTLMEPDVNTILSFWKVGVQMVYVHT